MFGAVSSMAAMIGIENRGRLAFYSRKPGVCDAEDAQGQDCGGAINAGFAAWGIDEFHHGKGSETSQGDSRQAW